MIRPLTALMLLGAAGAGLHLYSVKQSTTLLERELRDIRRHTEAARERSQVLRAEWALLNEPDRLRTVVQRHLPLDAMTPAQFVRESDLARRLPPVQVFAGAPSLFAPTPGGGTGQREPVLVARAAGPAAAPVAEPAGTLAAATPAARPASASSVTALLQTVVPAPPQTAAPVQAQPASPAPASVVAAAVPRPAAPRPQAPPPPVLPPGGLQPAAAQSPATPSQATHFQATPAQATPAQATAGETTPGRVAPGSVTPSAAQMAQFAPSPSAAPPGRAVSPSGITATPLPPLPGTVARPAPPPRPPAQMAAPPRPAPQFVRTPPPPDAPAPGPAVRPLLPPPVPYGAAGGGGLISTASAATLSGNGR